MMPTRLDPNAGSIQQYWMRSVSFAKLHWMLCFVAEHPTGLRARDINLAAASSGLLRGRVAGSTPSATRLYHYRATLVRLNALRREGTRLYANDSDPDVRCLVQNPPRDLGNKVLDTAAKDPFAALVLRNADCRLCFFDAFMISDVSPLTVADFRQHAKSVKYTIERSKSSLTITLANKIKRDRRLVLSSPTERRSPPVVQAIPYGIRYWAHKELDLIDEYCHHSDGSIVMFPLLEPIASASKGLDPRVREIANHILSLRDTDDWTVLAIYDLIARCCEARRRPLRLLYKAIDLLMCRLSRYIVLIPTPRRLAAIGIQSTQREKMELRNYYRYRGERGPYISHLRIHKSAPLIQTEAAVARA